MLNMNIIAVAESQKKNKIQRIRWEYEFNAQLRYIQYDME